MTNKEPKNFLQSPRGMHDITGEEYYRAQGLFEKAQEIAAYYGFSPIETPALEYEDLFVKGVGSSTDVVEKEMYRVKTKGGDHLVLRPEGTAGVMRSYIEHGLQNQPQPVMFYYSGPFFRHENPQKGRLRQFHQFGLEVLGTSKAIADVLVIRSMLDIIEEVGIKNIVVEINSIGDSICRPHYIRALTNYYKKLGSKICSDCDRRLKDNPLRVLDCKNPHCQELKAKAPDPVAHLCTACKEHFKEVMEYLDSLKIEYHLNPTLVRGLDYYTRTVFEIIAEIGEGEEKKKLAICSGGRYDNLAKALGHKKTIPGAGAAFGYERMLSVPGIDVPSPRIIKKPKVYFIQLGFEARIKSLSVIEMLRKAKIPMSQALSKEGLSPQLAVAEKTGIPYVIIFGQKEALENTVIVRHMQNRSQETVPLSKLPDYLKRLK